ncbi:hypothetical protein MNBD_PLANCTO03-1752 [hydrothermal vent metagenome]|uniref:LamG-like jellyroll fold domain-containing protein n=1 Tax=hydrothermal vent metagenome TaxID=652676 RepID=A0A3B1D4E2_9ZZZZ
MIRPPSSRRGSVYVLVIISMAIAGAVVLSSLELSSGRNTEAALVTNSVQARHYAHSAIEHGFAILTSEPTWRWTRGDGGWGTDIATDRGTFDLRATGVGGDALSQDAWLPATLTGIGRVGRSRSMFAVQVGLQGEGVPDIGDVVFSNTGLAIWPFEGVSSAAKHEQVRGNLANIVDGSTPFRAGAVPGLGASTAPWFSDGSYATMALGAGYENIRTVSFWLWADNTTTAQGVLNRDALGFSKGSWACFLASDRLSVYVESAGGTSSMSVLITPRQWHHVVFTFEESEIVLYLDGVEVDNSPSPSLNFWNAAANIEDLYVGVSHSFSLPGSASVSFPFTGSICHVVLMGEPLDDDDVEDLYDGYPVPAEYKVLVDTWSRISDY